jgi:hypothetical protein
MNQPRLGTRPGGLGDSDTQGRQVGWLGWNFGNNGFGGKSLCITSFGSNHPGLGTRPDGLVETQAVTLLW